MAEDPDLRDVPINEREDVNLSYQFQTSTALPCRQLLKLLVDELVQAAGADIQYRGTPVSDYAQSLQAIALGGC